MISIHELGVDLHDAWIGLCERERIAPLEDAIVPRTFPSNLFAVSR